MTDRPVEAGRLNAIRAAEPGGRRRAAMSDRDVAILRSLADRIDPADAGAHNNLGVVFFQKGLVEDAVAAFERALELDPRLEVARTNIRIAFEHTGHYRQRISDLVARVAAEPADDDARDALARSYLLGGEAANAAREWRAMLERYPSSVPLHMKLAYAEGEAGRGKEAEHLLTRALAMAPGEATIHARLAELRQARGDLSGAAASAERAVALAPEDARIHVLLADLLGALGRRSEAESVRTRAAALDSATLEEEHHLSLERYFSIDTARSERQPAAAEGGLGRFARAMELRAAGDYDGAVRELDRALAAGEDEPEIRQARAELRLLRGDVGAAAAEYQALLAVRPDSPKLWNERGVALHRGGSLDEAVDAYRRAVATDARYALAWNNLAVGLAQSGDGGAAERAFRKAADGKAPAEVLWNLALFLGRDGRPADAVEACRVALDVDDGAAESWARLGSALFQAGQTAEARNALVQALELDPAHAEARYQLGFTLSALGDFQGALRETKRALELDPLFPAPLYRLLIDVQFEAGSLPAPDPEGERVRPGAPVRAFRPDTAALDRAFAGLDLSPQSRSPGAARDLDQARTALRRGQPGRAVELAGRALAIDPGAIEPLLLQARAYLDRGLAGEALERFEAVLRTADRELAGEARLGKARSLLLLGRPEEAAEAVETLRGPAALALRGRALLAAGDPEQGLRAYEAAAMAGDPDAPLLSGLGEALLTAGRPADAEPVFRRALASEPEGVAARVGLARALESLGDYAAAEEQYQAAVGSLPSYGDAVLRLADLRWRDHRRPAALRGLIELLQIDPTHVPGLVRLGTYLYELGRGDQARAALERALRFEPDNAAAVAELSRLDRGEGPHAD